MGAQNHQAYVDHLKFSLLAYGRYKGCDLEVIKRAIAVAEQAHAQQKRDGGEPYIIHPLRVAMHVLVVYPPASTLEVAVALLHDILEDSPSWTKARVSAEFGDQIAQAVDILSKTSAEKELSAEEYKRHIINAPQYVRLIKLCDRLDNILSCRSCPDSAKVMRYLERTEAYYRDIAKETDERLLEVILEDITLQRGERTGCGNAVDKL